MTVIDMNTGGSTTRPARCADTHMATLFERRLCRRNPFLGEASEGAGEAPSE